MHNSIWTTVTPLSNFKMLQGNLKTDILIIGGGMSGILCAHYLHQMGVDYTLVEAQTIGSGISENTTAKITSQHGLKYHNLLKGLGLEKAKMYLDINELALYKYRELCNNIDCDFETKSAYTYSLSNRTKIEDEINAVNSLGFSATFTEYSPLPFEICGAIKFENQGQFHPLKFINHISENLHIYEHTFVKSLCNHIAVTDHGEITAKKIIIATHFPFLNTYGNYFLKLYQHRSYVIALENATQINGMYIDEAQLGMSFRNYKDLLFVGGGGHRTGKSGGNWQELRTFSNKYYPNANEKYTWSTQDCMSLDGLPYIGHYSPSMPDVYVATGFNKWGMTTSMVSAMILKDMIMDKRNEFSELFSPQRSIFKPQLFTNGFETLTSMFTPSTKRCPHLGCTLKWNKAEHTWDCPCHGSRFESNGKLIDNPAMKGIKHE